MRLIEAYDDRDLAEKVMMGHAQSLVAMKLTDRYGMLVKRCTAGWGIYLVDRGEPS